MNTIASERNKDMWGNVMTCAFCWSREQHTHGEVKREFSPEWQQFIPVCRKHTLYDEMIDGNVGPL